VSGGEPEYEPDMLFDTHCHLDRYAEPLAVASKAEQAGVVTVGMTGLPSHLLQA